MDKLAFGGGGSSGGTENDTELTTEQRIQQEIAGDDVLVHLFKFELTIIVEVCDPRSN